MFTEGQLNNYADVLLWGMTTAKGSPFGGGEIVMLRYDRPALPLAEVIFSRLLERGIHPLQRMTFSPTMEQRFYQLGNDDQLTFRAPGEETLFRNLNGSIFLYAPESLTHLADIDPKKIGKAAVARKHLRDILTKREEEGLFGWTLCAFPTEALCSHAGLSIEAYTEQIIGACFLDHSSPVSEWEGVYRNAVAIKKWLNDMSVDHYNVESETIDLTVTPGDKRKWIGLSGHNIPSFELFLSPDWRGVRGRYFANQPSYRSGNLVEGVELIFEEGRVVRMTAQKGEAFVRDQLSMDEGANRVGEFSLTDRRFSRIDRFMANTLFDENFGGDHGNCHVAVGSSYSDTYDGDPKELTKERKQELGFNDSALHWDLVNTEQKRVTAHLTDGGRVVIYEDGEFRC